jgi:Skp family chaperone for outer membrane proteins
MNWAPSQRFISIIISIFILGVLGTLLYLATGDLTTRETGLLSTILTILSVIVAWIVSHVYSETGHAKAIDEVKSAHHENLQTYALKAAEKVTNLSDQLDKLSVYISEELENSDYETVEETLRAREERLQSAIHMIGMLKSINDTALSDWQGVIGDQLEEQREERQEREQELMNIAEKLESISNMHYVSGMGNVALERQVDDISRDVRILMKELSVPSVKVHKATKKVRREVSRKCPNCDNELSYLQRARLNSYKLIKCTSCEGKLISKYSKEDDDFTIECRREIEEKYQCPDCIEDCIILLDNYPSSSKSVECNKCNARTKIVRLQNGGFKVALTSSPGEMLTEEFLQQVIRLMPDQPWPTGAHKEVALKLGCASSQVSKANKELIRRGRFKRQVDGELYETVKLDSSH